MAKVNMIGGDGQAFSTSLKNSRVHIANGTASLAEPTKKATKKPAAKKAASKAPAKRTYRTRALKATK